MDIWEAFDTLVALELWPAHLASGRSNSTLVQLEQLFLNGVALAELHIVELNAVLGSDLPRLDQRLNDQRSDAERGQFRRVLRDACRSSGVNARQERGQRARAAVEAHQHEPEQGAVVRMSPVAMVPVPAVDPLDDALADLRALLARPQQTQDHQEDVEQLRVLVAQRDCEVEGLRQQVSEFVGQQESFRAERRRLDDALLTVARLNRRVQDLSQEVGTLQTRNHDLEQRLQEAATAVEFHASRAAKLFTMVNEMAVGRLGIDTDKPEPLPQRNVKKRTPEQVKEDRQKIAQYIATRGRATRADIMVKFQLKPYEVNEELRSMLRDGQIRKIPIPGNTNRSVYEVVPNAVFALTMYDHIMVIARSMLKFQVQDVPAGEAGVYLKIQKLVREGKLRRQKNGGRVYYSLVRSDQGGAPVGESVKAVLDPVAPTVR